MMEWISIIVGLLLMWFGLVTPVQEVPEPIPGPTYVPTEAPAEGETMKIDITIESVEVLILESFPMQVQLQVRGYHDGCEAPVQVAQSRSDNHVEVRIYRELPIGVACPMIAVPYEATIPLDGTFETEDFTVTVNGQVVR